MKPSPAPAVPILGFPRQADLYAWLEESHASSPGLWLRLAKKGSGEASVTYDEAVDAALCFGWIDGQKAKLDDKAWLQKFTPRGPKSLWSKINRERVARLIEGGRMKPAGLAAIERAKQNGQWEAAYDSPSKATVPPDFEAALGKSKVAKAFFATLNSANRYAILWRIQTVKRPETRAKRIQTFIEMLKKKEKLYP